MPSIQLYQRYPHWPRASRPARSQWPCGHSRRHTTMPSRYLYRQPPHWPRASRPARSQWPCGLSQAASINAVRPSLLTTSTLAPCDPASAVTVAVWPYSAASINAVHAITIDGINVGPVRPGQRGHSGRLAIHGGMHQCRTAIFNIDNIHIGPVRLDQRVHNVRVAIPGGKQKCRPALDIDSLHVGPVRLDQRVHNVRVAILGGKHQRRPAISINGIHIGAVCPGQRIHSGRLAIRGGMHQRRLAIRNHSIHVGPVRPRPARSQCPCGHSGRQASMPSCPIVIDSIHIGPVRPNQRGYQGQIHTCTASINETVAPAVVPSSCSQRPPAGSCATRLHHARRCR